MAKRDYTDEEIIYFFTKTAALCHVDQKKFHHFVFEKNLKWSILETLGWTRIGPPWTISGPNPKYKIPHFVFEMVNG